VDEVALTDSTCFDNLLYVRLLRDVSDILQDVQSQNQSSNRGFASTKAIFFRLKQNIHEFP
jgi:hypothetical protein